MKNVAALAYAALIVLFVSFCALSIWWTFEPAADFIRFDRLEPCDEKGVVKRDFKVGETFYTCREGEVLRQMPRMVHQSIVNDDSRVIYMRTEPTMAMRVKPGPFKLILRIAELPPYLPPGNYSFRLTMVYTLNPLRRGEEYQSPHTHFKVVK